MKIFTKVCYVIGGTLITTFTCGIFVGLCSSPNVEVHIKQAKNDKPEKTTSEETEE